MPLLPVFIVSTAIRPDDFHFPRTRLVAVETTHNKAFGTPLPQTFMDQVGSDQKGSGNVATTTF